MNELTIVLLILAIVSGIVSIGLIAGKIQIRSSILLKRLLNTIILFNIWLIQWFIFQYFIVHIQQNISFFPAQIIARFISLTGLILLAVWAYSYFKLLATIFPAFSLFGLKEKKMLKLLLLLIALLIISYILEIGFRFLVYSYTENIFIDSLIIVGLVSSFNVIIKLKGTNTKEPIKSLVFIFLLIFLLFATHKIFYYFDKSLFNLSTIVIFEICIDITLNILTILWLQKYNLFIKREGDRIITLDDNTSIERMKVYKLSKREFEVIALVSKGMTNQEIADKLFISLKTVKGHLYNIFQKTQVSNRTQLAKLYSGTEQVLPS